MGEFYSGAKIADVDQKRAKQIYVRSSIVVYAIWIGLIWMDLCFHLTDGFGILWRSGYCILGYFTLLYGLCRINNARLKRMGIDYRDYNTLSPE